MILPQKQEPYACQCNLCTRPFDAFDLATLDGSMNSTSSLSTSSSSSTISFRSSASAGIKELDLVRRIKKGMGKPLGIAGAPIIQGAGDYTFGDLLHQGSTAQIKIAEDHITRRKVIAKITPRANRYAVTNVPNEAEDKEDYASCETSALQRLRDEHAVREAQILLLLRHPNLVQVRDFITASDHYCLVMEHIPGTALLHHVIRHQYLSETRARHYAHQIWRALDYLHGHAIAHLDLRIDNILLQDDQIKIIDFSTASVYTSQPLHKRRYICRSIHYTAPELLDSARETFEGPPVDIWSFGILLYIMVTGEMPFEGNSPEQVSRRIQQGQISYPGRLSPECRQLLKSMLAIDPHERITLTQVAHHPWFRTLPPATDIPNRKPLKPPLDPFIVQMMARAFRIGSFRRVAKMLTGLIEESKDQQNHPLVSLYCLHLERLAYVSQFSFDNDSASTVWEEVESLSERNGSECSFVMPSPGEGGLQLVFNPPALPQQEEQKVDREQQHRKPRLLRRIKNWYACRLGGCKK